MCWSICIFVGCYFALFHYLQDVLPQDHTFPYKSVNFVSAVGLFWVYWLACGFDIPAVEVGESVCQLPSQHKLGSTRFSFWQENRLNSRESCIFLNFYSKTCHSMSVNLFLLYALFSRYIGSLTEKALFVVYCAPVFSVFFPSIFLIGQGKYTWK